MERQYRLSPRFPSPKGLMILCMPIIILLRSFVILWLFKSCVDSSDICCSSHVKRLTNSCTPHLLENLPPFSGIVNNVMPTFREATSAMTTCSDEMFTCVHAKVFLLRLIENPPTRSMSFAPGWVLSMFSEFKWYLTIYQNASFWWFVAMIVIILCLI